MNESAKFRFGLVITLWLIIFIWLYSLFSPNLPDLNFSYKCNAIDYNSLRPKIGFVSQETQLFAGTIK
ncbi:MAG: hypothetical protein AAB885_00680, partial [Patescibacteria group bacterium]